MKATLADNNLEIFLNETVSNMSLSYFFLFSKLSYLLYACVLLPFQIWDLYSLRQLIIWIFYNYLWNAYSSVTQSSESQVQASNPTRSSVYIKSCLVMPRDSLICPEGKTWGGKSRVRGASEISYINVIDVSGG